MPNRGSDSTSYRLSGRMPGGMLEYISDRMPERKPTYATVGITRNSFATVSGYSHFWERHSHNDFD